jgi:hypothetical protein
MDPMPAFPGAPNGQVVGPNGQVIGPGGVINGPNGPITVGPNGMPMNTQPTTTSRPGQLPQQVPQQPQVPNPYGNAEQAWPHASSPPGGGRRT